MTIYLILIFVRYLVLIIIHLFRYKDFYKSFFCILIYQPKKISSFFKHSYSTITALELVTKFAKISTRSHIEMKVKNLPEIFQHAFSVSKINNPDRYYHISKPYQGYDALSFNVGDLGKIILEKKISLLSIHEKKTLRGNISHSRIKKIIENYSVPNKEGLNNQGARPSSITHADFKTFSLEDYNIFNGILQTNPDLFFFPNINVKLDNFSNFYGKIEFNSKSGHLGNGTIITDSGVEYLENLYRFLEKNEEMCIYINNLIDENPFFPLTI